MVKDLQEGANKSSGNKIPLMNGEVNQHAGSVLPD